MRSRGESRKVSGVSVVKCRLLRLRSSGGSMEV